MVGNAHTLGWRGLGGANIHPAVHGARVGGNDLCVEAHGEGDCRIRLSDSSRPAENDQQRRNRWLRPYRRRNQRSTCATGTVTSVGRPWKHVNGSSVWARSCTRDAISSRVSGSPALIAL